MNIKQITYLVATVESGSLSGAAKDLFVTVQAVSKAIADLERELGRDLLVRESRGVHPTPFGHAFHQKAVGVLESFKSLESFALNYEEGAGLPDCLRLALNTPAFMGNEMVRENTAAFLRSRLGIEVTNDLATGEVGFEGLRSGLYDALITVGSFCHADVECRAVGTVPAGVMMSRKHPLVEKDAVTLADLEPYPVALSRWFHHSNDTIVSCYRERGANLNFVELTLDGIGPFLREQGVIFTTGIPALERTHPMAALRLMAPEDAVAVPICFVCMKDRAPLVLAAVDKAFAGGGIPFLSR